MAKPTLSLQSSEASLAQSATYIYAAYVASARVPDGQEKEWIKRSIREAFLIARLTEASVQSDTELS